MQTNRNERNATMARNETPRTFDGYFDRKKKERPRWNVEHEARKAAAEAAKLQTTERDDMTDDLFNKTFTDFLASADLETLRRKRAWLPDYASRTHKGHSEIARNLAAYDAEIARRTPKGVGDVGGYGGGLMEGGY